MAESDDDLRTPAWLLVGLTGNVPGVLELYDGRLSFRTEEGAAFDVPLAHVRVRFPWWWFGGGAQVTAAGTAYRLSFVRPNGAEDVPGRLLAHVPGGEGAALATAARKMEDVGAGREAGKAWKARLPRA
jgi:hypothetical protein